MAVNFDFEAKQLRRRIRELEKMFGNLQAEAKMLLENLNKAASERDRLREAIETHRSRITQGSNGDLALWKALEGK